MCVRVWKHDTHGTVEIASKLKLVVEGLRSGHVQKKKEWTVGGGEHSSIMAFVDGVL